MTQGGSSKTYYSLLASDGDPYAITRPMELIPVSSISDVTIPTATPLSSSVNHANVAKHLTTRDKVGIGAGVGLGIPALIGAGVGVYNKLTTGSVRGTTAETERLLMKENCGKQL